MREAGLSSLKVHCVGVGNLHGTKTSQASDHFIHLCILDSEYDSELDCLLRRECGPAQARKHTEIFWRWSGETFWNQGQHSPQHIR